MDVHFCDFQCVIVCPDQREIRRAGGEEADEYDPFPIWPFDPICPFPISPSEKFGGPAVRKRMKTIWNGGRLAPRNFIRPFVVVIIIIIIIIITSRITDIISIIIIIINIDNMIITSIIIIISITTIIIITSIIIIIIVSSSSSSFFVLCF